MAVARSALVAAREWVELVYAFVRVDRGLGRASFFDAGEPLVESVGAFAESMNVKHDSALGSLWCGLPFPSAPYLMLLGSAISHLQSVAR